jgi:hypothetical protein
LASRISFFLLEVAVLDAQGVQL